MSDDQKFPSQLADRFQVRMPDGLRDRLRDAAEANKRSMNAEIIARLEASFEQAGELEFYRRVAEDRDRAMTEGLQALEEKYAELAALVRQKLNEDASTI